MKKEIVIKIGGSILYDNGLNVNFKFLRKFKDWYISSGGEYENILVVVGGGKLSRILQNKVDEYIKDDEYLHELGMSATQVNANLVKGFLDDENIYVPRGLGDAYEYLKTDGKLRMVSGGLKIGWSTDLDAVVFADVLGIDRVFKISDVEYIYSTDPKRDSNAKAIKDISWDEYFRMFGISKDTEHIPNEHIPIDAMCAQFAGKKNISIHISGGYRLENIKDIEDLFQDGSFIHP